VAEVSRDRLIEIHIKPAQGRLSIIVRIRALKYRRPIPRGTLLVHFLSVTVVDFHDGKG